MGNHVDVEFGVSEVGGVGALNSRIPASEVTVLRANAPGSVRLTDWSVMQREVMRAPWWQADTAFSFRVSLSERIDRWNGAEREAALRAAVAATGSRRFRRSIFVIPFGLVDVNEL